MSPSANGMRKWNAQVITLKDYGKQNCQNKTEPLKEKKSFKKFLQWCWVNKQ